MNKLETLIFNLQKEGQKRGYKLWKEETSLQSHGCQVETSLFPFQWKATSSCLSIWSPRKINTNALPFILSISSSNLGTIQIKSQ